MRESEDFMIRRKMLRLFLPAVLLALALTTGWAWQLASRSTDEWIKRMEAPDRVAGLKINEVVAALHLKPGEIVTDIGAGPGLFSFPMAKAVAPKGRVLAVEIDQGLLDYVAEKAKKEKIDNVDTVLGKYDDPSLPRRDIDVAFFHDVLHHIEHRQLYVKNLAGYLKPTGRIVVIDMVKPHPENAELQTTLDQVKQWMADAGLQPVEDIKLFPDKYFVIFQKPGVGPR